MFVDREEVEEVVELAVAEVLELKGCGICCVVLRSVEHKNVCIDSIPIALRTRPSASSDLLYIPTF